MKNYFIKLLGGFTERELRALIYESVEQARYEWEESYQILKARK